MTANGLINNLPDHCLSQIFSHLSIEDHLRVHGVCKRWRGLDSDVWQDVKKVDLMKLDKLRSQHSRIVSLCGNSLQALSVTVFDDSDVLATAAACCENLRKVRVIFDSFRKTEEQFQDLNKLFIANPRIRGVILENVQKDFLANIYCLFELSAELEELELWGFKACKKERGADAEATVWYQPCDVVLTRFTKLQHFVLNGFRVRGEDLKAIEHMKELRFLELYEDHDSSDYNIDRIAKLTKLEYLFVQHAKNTTDEWCAELVRNNPNLRHLKFSVNVLGSRGLREFSKLEMLEILEVDLYCSFSITDDDYKNFYSLKKFECNMVGDAAVTSLLENCRQLEFIKVSAFRDRITSQVLDVAHRVTSARLDTPLHIIVDSDVIDKWKVPEDLSPLLTIEDSVTYFNRIRYNY